MDTRNHVFFHGCRNNSDIAHFRTLPRDLLNHGLWGVVNARGVGLIIPIYGTVDISIVDGVYQRKFSWTTSELRMVMVSISIIMSTTSCQPSIIKQLGNVTVRPRMNARVKAHPTIILDRWNKNNRKRGKSSELDHSGSVFCSSSPNTTQSSR